MTLIERYDLSDRIADQTVENIRASINRAQKGKGRAVDSSPETHQTEFNTIEDKKKYMIVECRRKMMEKLIRERMKHESNTGSAESN